MEHFHGLTSKAMTLTDIQTAIHKFREAARRARTAGMDGIELHASNGYLFTQFLSSAINTRKDEYGGTLVNRSRFLMEVVREIRKEVGRDYHLQVKFNAADYHNDYFLNFGREIHWKRACNLPNGWKRKKWTRSTYLSEASFPIQKSRGPITGRNGGRYLHVDDPERKNCLT